MLIYKTTNLINNKIYIGKDSRTRNHLNYLGSGLILKQSIKKYGRENFKKEIIEYCKTKEELNEREKFWIKELKSQQREIGYNIATGGEGGDVLSNHPNKKEINKKRAKSMIGRVCSKQTRKLISKANTGKKRTEQQCNNIKKSLIGKMHGFKGKHTQKTRKTISKANKGRILSKETRDNMSRMRKGTIWIFNKNLNKCRMIKNDEIIPKGYEKGKNLQSEKTKEKIGRSSKNRIWIYNKELNVRKFIKKTQTIPEGFVKGRNSK